MLEIKKLTNKQKEKINEASMMCLKNGISYSYFSQEDVFGNEYLLGGPGVIEAENNTPLMKELYSKKNLDWMHETKISH